MNVHVLKHVPFEDIGNIAEWVKNAKACLSYTKFYEKIWFPEVKNIDLLIIMGGPMSINDELQYPWLCEEKKFIQKAVKQGVAIIGICLGAQLIANVFGACVYKNSHKEIGWFPVTAENNLNSEFNFPRECIPLNWHGETFDLPKGSIRLASSQACMNQAFQIGKRIIGLQFHLEVTQESVQSLINNCRHELGEGKFIQSESEILSKTNVDYARINCIMNDVLNYITQARNKETDN